MCICMRVYASFFSLFFCFVYNLEYKYIEHKFLLKWNKLLEDVYQVTAPMDRPQRPIRDTCLFSLKYDTTILRSSFCDIKREKQKEFTSFLYIKKK